MTHPQRSIFRANAVRRYIQGREEAVLPRFVSPRTFAFLWILLGLLMAGGLVAWGARMPVYASGPAVVVDGRARGLSRDDVAVVAFLPPQHLSHLQIGQRLWLRLDSAAERFGGPVLAVERAISSPDRAQKRFALHAGAARAVTQPAVVVVARWQPPQNDLAPSTYVGSVCHADIEVGSRRVISLLPLVGPLFGD